MLRRAVPCRAAWVRHACGAQHPWTWTWLGWEDRGSSSPCQVRANLPAVWLQARPGGQQMQGQATCASVWMPANLSCVPLSLSPPLRRCAGLPRMRGRCRAELCWPRMAAGAHPAAGCATLWQRRCIIMYALRSLGKAARSSHRPVALLGSLRPPTAHCSGLAHCRGLCCCLLWPARSPLLVADTHRDKLLLGLVWQSHTRAGMPRCCLCRSCLGRL